MSTISSERAPTPEELTALQDALLIEIDLLERSNRRMRHQRWFLAWGALMLTAANTAALFVSEGVVNITLGCMQIALWTVIAAMNFGWSPLERRQP